ncbi:hypothetical protein [Aquimarina aggregata]|uniref:hypothetical protein n=1 Tax=Aquimarina aggregata TaxID=1642818 RepID=UPI00248FA92C|nr:hypothetical protein [Aquimarina aggregata]
MKLNKRKRHIILLLFPIVIAISIAFTNSTTQKGNITATLLTKSTTFEAGQNIQLDFKLSDSVVTELFLHSSYGTTVITPNLSDNTQFDIPDFMANKKGRITYTLVYKSKGIASGEIKIIATTEQKVFLESYIGPPSIIAGGRDYTMQTVLANDSYDNPIADSTKVIMKHQFLDRIEERELYSKDMITWTNIFSYKKSGRMLLFSKVHATVSKEFSVEVYPSLPENFEITSKREHIYADGNQITEFITSIIRDENGNIVSDGTMVDFSIKDKSGLLLHTQGKTIEGKAVAKMLHPSHHEIWQIKGYVHGMAESNTLLLEYEAVLDDFNVQFTNHNREIKVGPLISFMEQLIPDGAIVKMNIIKNGIKIDTKIESSSQGLVRFILQEGFYDTGEYTIVISALGVEKKYNDIRLK